MSTTNATPPSEIDATEADAPETETETVAAPAPVYTRRTMPGTSRMARAAKPLAFSPEDPPLSAFPVGARVFHEAFGRGDVTAVDGLKLTITFDTAGAKKVMDSFVKGA